MNSTLFAGIAIAQFDRDLFEVLRLRKAAQDSVSCEPLQIGIRNEFGEIYRAVGTSKPRHFEKLIKRFSDLGFSNELVPVDQSSGQLRAEPTSGYKAIFNRQRKKNWPHW